MVAAIEWSKLVQVLWVAPLAGITVTTMFSVAIYGTSRAAEARREGNGTAATLFAVLGAVALVAFLGGVAFGVSVILSK